MSAKVRTANEILSINSQLYRRPDTPRALMNEESVETHNFMSDKAERYKAGFIDNDFGHVRPPSSQLSTTRSIEIDAWREQVLCRTCALKKQSDDEKGLTYFYYKYTPPPPTEATRGNSRLTTTCTSKLPLRKCQIPHQDKSATFFDEKLQNLPSHIADISLHYADARCHLPGKKYVDAPIDNKPKQSVYDVTTSRPDSGVIGDIETREHIQSDKNIIDEQVGNRSKSNDLLHFVSIDDCHMKNRHPKRRILSATPKKEMIMKMKRDTVTAPSGESYRQCDTPCSGMGESITSLQANEQTEHIEQTYVPTEKIKALKTNKMPLRRMVSPYSLSSSCTSLRTNTTSSQYGGSSSDPQPRNQAVVKAFNTLLSSKDVVNNSSKRGLFKYEKFANKKICSSEKSLRFNQLNAALHQHIDSAILNRQKPNTNSSLNSRDSRNSATRDTSYSLTTQNLLNKHIERRLQQNTKQSERRSVSYLQELVEEENESVT